MHKTIFIKSDKQKDHAVNLIQHLTYGDVHEVCIKQCKESLSSRQRKLYWLWLTEIGNDRGESKDDLHLDYKERFLVPIYFRDDAGYRAMCDAVKAVKQKGMAEHYKSLKFQIVRLTSIVDANTKQMAEYLTDIDREATGQGVILTRPENQHILGRKK